jgi:hypothetical protein
MVRHGYVKVLRAAGFMVFLLYLIVRSDRKAMGGNERKSPR